MKRAVFAIAAVAIVAGVVVLWLKLRADGAQTGTGLSTEPGATTVAIGGSTDSTGSTQPTGGSNPDRPALPAGSAVAWGGNGVGSSYQIGNMTVRDHRKGDHKPMDIPPNLHPADGRKVNSALVAELSRKIRGIVSDCTGNGQVPPEARGPKPRMEGEITIVIKAHVLSVTSSVIQLRDVLGASLDPSKACIEKKALELTHPAPDEADVENYQINLAFAVL